MMLAVSMILFSALATQAAPAERTMRRYPLGTLRAQSPPPGALRWGSFLTVVDNSEQKELGSYYSEDTDRFPLSAAAVLDILRTVVKEDATFDAQVDSVLAVATEPQHQIIAATLKTLRDEVGAPIPVDVQVYEVPADKPIALAAVLTAAETPKAMQLLEESGRLLWSSTVDAALGRNVTAGSVQQTPFVVTYGTEIAQKSQLATPHVGSVASGVYICMRLYPILGGGATHATVVASRAAMLGVSRFDTRARNVGPVELPRSVGSRAASTASIPADGALVLRTLTDDLNQSVFVIRPRAGKRTMQMNGASIAAALVPTGLLADASGAAMPMLGPNLHPLTDDAGSTVRTPRLADLVRGDDSALTRCEDLISGYYIIAAGAPAAVKAAQSRIEAQELKEAATVSLQFDVVRADDARLRSAKTIASATIAASNIRSAGAQLGREETAVVRYEGQVAQDAYIAQPVATPLFHGTVVRARLLELRDASCLVQIDGLYADYGPRERVTSETASTGDFERIPLRSSRCGRIVEIPFGRSVVLGDFGADGAQHLYLTAAAASAPLR